MRISPEQLITFSVVAEFGSVSKAATALNLSQPAVSGQLKALQAQVGQPLYQRRAHGIILTPAGEHLLPYAHAVTRNVQQVEEQIHDLQHRPAKPIKLGFSYALSSQIAPLVVKVEKVGLVLIPRANPSANLVAQVLSGELDAAIVASPVHMPAGKLESRVIGEDELKLIVPAGHRLGSQGSINLANLMGETLLWAAPGSAVRQQANRLLDASSLPPQRFLDLGSLDAVRVALLEGYGIAILPSSFVHCELRAGLVHALTIEALGTTVQQLLITPPEGVLSPEVRLLAEHLLPT